MDDALRIWTIGHGLLELTQFLPLLAKYEISAVSDVRSQPYSERAPQYNREALAATLESASIAYVFQGRELGGRPAEAELYDADGHVLYRRLAEVPRAVDGINHLIAGARNGRVAVLCSESDPDRCHRNLLVGRMLRERGAHVTHILKDGKTKEFEDALVAAVGLPGLEEDPWRSLVQVRPELARKASSRA